MNEPTQQTSDSLLTRLRRQARSIIEEYPAVVHPLPQVRAEELLALVECAEALRDILPLIDTEKTALTAEQAVLVSDAKSSVLKLEAL